MSMWYVLVYASRNAPGKSGHMEWGPAALLGLAIFFGAGLVQLPMRIAKLAFRYRLIMPGATPMPTASERIRYHLKDLLVAAFIIAIAMSPFRLVMPGGGKLEIDPTAIFTIPMCAVVTAFVVLPSLWAAFASRRAVWLAGLVATYCVLVACVEIAILLSLTGRRASAAQIYGALAFFAAGHVALGAVVYAVMRIYYVLGYRLQRVPRYAAPITAEPSEETIDA
jgi:hypothetical protein